MRKAIVIKFNLLLIVLLSFCILAFTACGDKEVDNFNLTFKVDGTSYETISTTGDEAISIPNNPTKNGYTFAGWYWDEGTWNEPFTANSLLNAPISSDMSVYAKFDAINYDITYESNGGAHNNPASYTIESEVALSDAAKDSMKELHGLLKNAEVYDDATN